MPRIERHIGLGWTADRFRVVATLTLETPEPGAVATFTDHTTGPAPERISVSWEALKYRGTSREEGSAGQVPSEDRVIARRAVAGQNGYNYSDADAETAAFIDAVWRDWHLNDMNAACDHMTPDALNPDAETLAAYRAEKTAERGEWREKTAERGEWREKYSPAFYGDADA
ncbi:MAG: hypothetical protein K0S70_149, partial [Microbacterium sp.]|nr:hypothetical protein [Microbacterium sp.]